MKCGYLCFYLFCKIWDSYDYYCIWSGCLIFRRMRLCWNGKVSHYNNASLSFSQPVCQESDIIAPIHFYDTHIFTCMVIIFRISALTIDFLPIFFEEFMRKKWSAREDWLFAGSKFVYYENKIYKTQKGGLNFRTFWNIVSGLAEFQGGVTRNTKRN